MDDIGNNIDLGTHTGLQGRLGLAYEFASEGSFQGRITGNILHNFTSDTLVTVGANELAASSATTWAELGAGATLQSGETGSFYGNATYRTAIGANTGPNSGLSVTAGWQYVW